MMNDYDDFCDLTISGSAGFVGAGGRSKPFNGARHHVSRFLAGSALSSVIVTSFGCPGTGLSVFGPGQVSLV